MKKALTLIAIMALMSFEPTPKSYKLELTAQELQVVYDAVFVNVTSIAFVAAVVFQVPLA